MGLNLTTISGGTSEVAGTSVTDGDSTTVPGSNSLVELEVTTIIEGAATPNQPTVTGKGLTWEAINTVSFTDGATFTGRTTKFRAMGASPTSAAVVVTTTGQTQSVWQWHLKQTADADTTGTNGSGAIVQSATNSGSGTAPTATLAAFGDATNNATDYVVSHGAPTSAITPEAGMTAFAQRDTTSYSLRDAWRLGQDTSPSATIAASRNWAVVAVEIKAAAAAPATRRVQPLVVRAERRRRAPVRLILFRTPTQPPADTTLAANLSATATQAAGLSTSITAAVALTATSTLVAPLATAITATTALSGTATVAGQLTTAIRLAIATTAQATLVADLQTTQAAARRSPIRLLDARTPARRRRSSNPPTILAAYQSPPSSPNLAASLTATASLAPALSTAIPLALAASATATLAAPLTASITLATAGTATATLAGSLSTDIRLAATPQASATLSPALSAASELSVVLAASAALSAQATTGITLAAAPTAVAALSPAIAAEIRFAAALSGSATLAPDLTSIVILGDLVFEGELMPSLLFDAGVQPSLLFDAGLHSQPPE